MRAWNTAIGRWLRKVRTEMDWTQAELARQLSVQFEHPVSVGQVYLWERGLRNVPGAVVMALKPLIGPDLARELWEEPKPRRRRRR